MLQKRLASQLLKCSPKKIRLNPEMADEINESITKLDVRGLLSKGVIYRVKPKCHSRGRARIRHMQHKKRRRSGQGSRKGSKNARQGGKREWINKIRKQRSLLKYLRSKNIITPQIYGELYSKSKGGFFRSVRHIKLYLHEKGLMK